MLQLDLINRFMDSRRIAVVGVSRKKDLPANYILKKLKASGYEAVAINPNADEIDGDRCYPSIKELQERPEAVMLAGTPATSENVIEECAEAGISLVWMHRGMGPGSYSRRAEIKCLEQGIDAITNGCPMMFIKPVDPFHRLLRWFKRF